MGLTYCRPVAVRQVLVGATPGDAVTNSALWLDDVLRAAGVDASIVARHRHPALTSRVGPLAPAGTALGPEDWLLVHLSIGDVEVADLLAATPARLALFHHNITPGRFVADLDPGFAAELDAGRALLHDLRPRVERAWAASAFNAAELVDLGYADVEVAPVVVPPPGRWDDVEAHPATAHHLEVVVDGPLVLSVGQLLPHKRPDLTVQAFHVLDTYLRPGAHLCLAGGSRFPAYAAGLQQLVNELVLDHAWFSGHVPDAELAALWRAAAVFVTTSEHEGFCVPVVEAMHHGVPVVARGHGALAETVGDAGLVLDADAGPELVAEALASVLDDDGLRAELVARGHRRAAVLTEAAEVGRRHLVAALGPGSGTA